MRRVSFVLFIAFVFGLFVDCCPSTEGHDESTDISLAQACDDVTETEHSASSNHACLCLRSCQLKIFSKEERRLLVHADTVELSFFDSDVIYESLDPLQIFHPPIA